MALLRGPTYLESTDDPVRRAHRLVGAGLPEEAEKVLLVWLDARLDDVGAHYEFLSVHFSIPRTQRDDATVRRFYDSLRGSSTGHRRDVATYALGLYFARLGDWQQALSHYEEVANRELPYLNNSRGVALLGCSRVAEAMPCFWREITLGNNVEGAVQNLSHFYMEQRDWSGLESLVANEATADHVPARARRTLLLHQHRLGRYLLLFLDTYRVRFVWQYALVALYGSFIWFLMIRWWDLFEKEPVGLSILVLLAGAAAANAMGVASVLT